MVVNSFIDQLGETIRLSYPPKRIISLVPSQTELLADLGLDDEVVGITKFCVRPRSWVKKKEIIGGTKNFRFDNIDRLSPDLIIGNKEENYKEGIIRLKEKYPVWMSDIVSVEDALTMMKSIGEIVSKAEEARMMIHRIVSAFSSHTIVKPKSVLYLLWKRPWMTAGGDTFINTMLGKAGLENCLRNERRYPELTDHDILSFAPELIFLSSEPYPFRDHHLEEIRSISPSSKVMLVDGEMFSWYGSRMLKAPAYFHSLAV